MFSLLIINIISISMPKFPLVYHLRGIWSIPYQSIKIPFLVQTDYIKKRQSETSFGGLMNEVHFLKSRSVIQQTGQFGPSCRFADIDDPEDELTEYLPLSEEGWTFMGEEVVNGYLCYYWERKGDLPKWFYRFYVEKSTLNPIRYYMDGPSIRGSHPAIYIFDIEDFGPSIIENWFEIPIICTNTTSSGPTKHISRDIKGSKKKIKNNKNCETFTPDIIENLPINFSWRDIPNVVPYPHDQAVCGSCWAQAGAEALSAQFSLHSKGNIQVSVQQIMDCTWSDISYACDGGELDDSYNILISNKTLFATEQEYPYIGVTGHCGYNFDKTIGTIKSCKQVIPNNEKALKSALFKYGPIAVSIVASLPSFRTYTSGPYNDPMCNPSKSEIDHSVLLTGWKRFGKIDTYEIMNSWSDKWGDNGFGYIVVGDNDCGITEFGFLPQVEYNEIIRK